MLEDGNIVIIKRFEKMGGKSFKEFIDEVIVLSQINNNNMVKLLRCCLETKVPILVYEFINNENLYWHLRFKTMISYYLGKDD